MKHQMQQSEVIEHLCVFYRGTYDCFQCTKGETNILSALHCLSLFVLSDMNPEILLCLSTSSAAVEKENRSYSDKSFLQNLCSTGVLCELWWRLCSICTLWALCTETSSLRTSFSMIRATSNCLTLVSQCNSSLGRNSEVKLNYQEKITLINRVRCFCSLFCFICIN